MEVGGADGAVGFGAAVLFPSIAFLVAGAAEAFDEDRSKAEVGIEIAKTAGKWLLGFFGYVLLLLLSGFAGETKGL
eukprot:COSAG06_NODE_966_length_11290_cov_4.010097_3_plen_76_part_00